MKSGDYKRRCFFLVSALILVIVAIYLFVSVSGMQGITSNFANQKEGGIIGLSVIIPLIILVCFIVIVIYLNVKK